MDDCKNQHRIDRLEDDVKELKESDKDHYEAITELKEGQAESRLFQKIIMENLAEIKVMVAQKKDNIPLAQNNPKDWMDLFKWVVVGTIGAIVTWMVTNGKIVP